jgi:hypothetical protein
MGAGLDRILQDTQTYYLLSYQPTNTRHAGRFRKIEIRLPGRHDLRVRTRRGYFEADARDVERRPPAPQPEEAGRRAAGDLRRALMSLYPRTEIPTRLSADFVSMGRAGLQAVVNGYVDLASVEFRKVGSRHEAAFVVAGVVFDEGGNLLTTLEPQRAGLSLEDEDYARALKAGLTYERTVTLDPGTYEVRLAVLQEGTERLGSASSRIDIPDPDAGSLTLSGVFLLRGQGVSTPALSPSGSDVSLRNVQAHPRFEPTDSLYYQVQVLNAAEDDSGQTRLTIQAQVLERQRLMASTRERPIALASLGAVPDAYTGRITLEPLRPGEYELRVSVTDHLARSAVSKHVAFAVVAP